MGYLLWAMNRGPVAGKRRVRWLFGCELLLVALPELD
jgi:hypothetical protein